MTENKQIRMLQRLAGLSGVELSYHNDKGDRKEADPDTLIKVLGSMGLPLASAADIKDAAREGARGYWRRFCEPVVVVWDGESAGIDLRLPKHNEEERAQCRLELESGGLLRWSVKLSRLPVLKTAQVDGVKYSIRRLKLISGLPLGYHRLNITVAAGVKDILIISAPRQAFSLSSGEKIWGVFLPLYALYSGQSWGAGSFTDLGALTGWVGKLGGSTVGTLPLLAAFLEEPFEPSPYSPVSRLFWNEFFIDIEKVQGSAVHDALQEDIDRLRLGRLVDYRAGMAVRRKVLENCADQFFRGSPGRQDSLWQWVKEKPMALEYARFRAVVDSRREGWPAWPGRMKSGAILDGDYDSVDERYHLFVQWVAHLQMEEAADIARLSGRGLYLDLPLGVNGGGFDVWKERDAFVLDSSVGAPPDQLCPGGQNWGFPPLHPERIREQGYRYYISCLRHHMRHAGILRLDHVMGLHHLFWIPGGMDADSGVYVKYRAEEFFAILALESRRHSTLIVGEDLGYVPEVVREAMSDHSIYGMYVLPFQYTGVTEAALRPAGRDSLTCLNTHDMPPFASYWLDSEKSARDRAVLPIYLYNQGWLEVAGNKVEEVLTGCLSHLAASQSQIMVVSLEDLWTETEPQNVPGTCDEYPNWRRKARYSAEEFTRSPEVNDILQNINRIRRKG
ncbi:MAG: 4-alpha-glucanotransferase [Desulfocucumaceae bacterium]